MPVFISALSVAPDGRHCDGDILLREAISSRRIKRDCFTAKEQERRFAMTNIPVIVKAIFFRLKQSLFEIRKSAKLYVETIEVWHNTFLRNAGEVDSPTKQSPTGELREIASQSGKTPDCSQRRHRFVIANPRFLRVKQSLFKIWKNASRTMAVRIHLNLNKYDCQTLVAKP
jgi:hypothetical protein